MKKAIYSIIILALILVSISQVIAIGSIGCIPSTVAQGGNIICEIDLASGTSEKNQAYNITFYNDTAQTIVINASGGGFCSFIGTTENSPDPINVIQGCTIPSDWGVSTTAVVNFSLTDIPSDITFQFNISSTSSKTILINNFIFDTLLVGQLTGARWTTTKQDTGKPIIGANCNGEILQLVSGILIPISGNTGLSSSIFSKYLGHTFTDFTPLISSVKEGTNYIFEVICDCKPSDECFDQDGNNLTQSDNPTINLLGIGTTSISIGTWLTSNTVTDKSNYVVGEDVIVSANITNPANRSRQDMIINYNIRCDSGNDSDTNRILIGNHREFRAIDSNKTQMQGHNFRLPDFESIEKGAVNCRGATDVTVLDELLNPLVTYSTISSVFTITTTRIHPGISWKRESRNIYSSNVSFDDFDIGVKSIEVTLNKLLMDTETQAVDIKNFTVEYMNGTAISFDTELSVHNRFVKTTELDESVSPIEVITISIKNVNTTLDDNFNVTITFVDFQNRQASALEGIENKTGTFHFDVDCPATAPIGEEMDCAITAFIEEDQLVQKEVDFTCYISTEIGRVSELNFNQMITRTPQTFNRKFLVTGDLAENNQHTLQCEAGYYNLGSRTDKFFDSFLVTEERKGVGISLPSLDELDRLDEKFVEKIKEIIDDIIPGELPLWIDFVIAGVIFIVFIFVIILIVFAIKRKKKSSD